MKEPCLTKKIKAYFFSVIDRFFLSLHAKYFSWEEIARFIITINKNNVQLEPTGYGGKKLP